MVLLVFSYPYQWLSPVAHNDWFVEEIHQPTMCKIKHLRINNQTGYTFLKGAMYILVGGFNPFEKYLSNWIISPGRDEINKKIFGTTTQYRMKIVQLTSYFNLMLSRKISSNWMKIPPFRPTSAQGTLSNKGVAAKWVASKIRPWGGSLRVLDRKFSAWHGVTISITIKHHMQGWTFLKFPEIRWTNMLKNVRWTCSIPKVKVILQELD